MTIRNVDYLRISVTDKCNLRCTYCMPEEGFASALREEILSYEEILSLVEKVCLPLGIDKFKITGGEPLVRREILSFLERLHRIPGIEDISLTTNGMLLPLMANDLYRTGLRRLNISIDSLDPLRFKKITRLGDLELVLKGIEKSMETGFSPIKLNVVTIRNFNDDEIGDFVRFVRNKPIELRFIETMPIGPIEWKQESFIPGEEVRQRIEAEFGPLKSSRTARGNGPARVYELADGTRIGFITAISEHFCDSCNRMRLTADGKLRSCLLTEGEVDIKSAMMESRWEDKVTALFKEAMNLKPEDHGHFINTITLKEGMAMTKIGG